jgi:hypothetical protein
MLDVASRARGRVFQGRPLSGQPRGQTRSLAGRLRGCEEPRQRSVGGRETGGHLIAEISLHGGVEEHGAHRCPNRRIGKVAKAFAEQ